MRTGPLSSLVQYLSCCISGLQNNSKIFSAWCYVLFFFFFLFLTQFLVVFLLRMTTSKAGLLPSLQTKVSVVFLCDPNVYINTYYVSQGGYQTTALSIKENVSEVFKICSQNKTKNSKRYLISKTSCNALILTLRGRDIFFCWRKTFPHRGHCVQDEVLKGRGMFHIFCSFVAPFHNTQ